MRSQTSIERTSSSRCSGTVEPIDTSSTPGASHSPSRIGVSSRERAAATTMSAPATASAALATAAHGTRSSRSSVGAARSRFAGFGLKSRTLRSVRTAASARTCACASAPLPSTPSVAGRRGASRSTATAEVAAVRSAVMCRASTSATSSPVSWSKSGSR